MKIHLKKNNGAPRLIKKITNMLFCMCFCVVAVGANAVNIAGAVVLSDDLKSQRLLFQSSRKNVQYNIALGAFKKVNSEWVVDDEQEVYANIDSATFEFVSRTSMSEAWDILKSNFVKSSSDVLFMCNGLDCGSSNVWANDYFKIKQLYGLNPSQRYLAIRNSLDGETTYKVLYMVKRGNRRIMAHVDTISPTNKSTDEDASADALSVQSGGLGESSKGISYTQKATEQDVLASIFQDQYWVFPVAVFNGSLDENRNKRAMDSYVQTIVKAMKRRTSLSLYVIGHNSQSVSQSIQLRESKKGAEQLYQALINAGIDKSRLTPLGLGSYVPRKGYLGTRVELVLRASQ